MALEFAAEAYEKRSGEKKINVLDGQKCLTESADDGRELLLTSRLVRAAVEVVSNIGENAVAEDTFDQDLIEKSDRWNRIHSRRSERSCQQTWISCIGSSFLRSWWTGNADCDQRQ